jgi:hypothetical protein
MRRLWKVLLESSVQFELCLLIGNNADDGLDTLAEQSAALFDNISDTDRERFSPSEGNSSGSEPDESVNESGEEEEGTSEVFLFFSHIYPV